MKSRSVDCWQPDGQSIGNEISAKPHEPDNQCASKILSAEKVRPGSGLLMSGNNGLCRGQWLAACLFSLAFDIRDCSFGFVITSAHRQPAWRFRQHSLQEKGKYRRDGANEEHIV